MSKKIQSFAMAALLGATSWAGCAHTALHRTADCETCETEAVGCADCDLANGVCCPRHAHLGGKLQRLEWKLCGWMWRKSNSIPEVLPLGSTVRAHEQVMETNGEAADFIFFRNDFVGQTAELTPDGKDRILEVAARMRSAPFPVIVEREPNNSDPELDMARRNLVALVLSDLGNPDAEKRTVIATAYGEGYVSQRAERMYYQHIWGGSFGYGNNNNRNNGGFGGGSGGGGGGGGFF